MRLRIPPPDWLLIPGLFSLALLLRLATLAVQPFDGLYGQDPYFYAGYARNLWSAIAEGAPLPQTSWPVGYPLLVALALPVTGFADSTGQWLSLAAGSAVAPLVYLLARDLLRQQGEPEDVISWTGLVAGLLAAVSGQLWQSSVVVMSDASALCWALLSAWALVRYARNGTPGWLLLVGFALAWAISTRWEYALLAVPYAAYSRMRRSDRKRLRHLAAALLVGVIVLGPQAFWLIDGAAVLGRSDVARWSPLNALHWQSPGFDRYPMPTALFYARPVLSPGYLLPLFTPALLIGGAHVLRRRRREMATLLLGWVLVMYAVLTGLPFQNFRYSLLYLPPIMILTAMGLHQVTAWAGRGGRAVACTGIVAGLVVQAGWGGYRVTGQIEAWEADKAVVKWAEGQLPEGATLLSHGLTLMVRHQTSRDVFDLHHLASSDLERLTADERPDYLLVDRSAFEAGRAGLMAQQNYRWLRDGPGLDELGGRGRYTLFRVRSLPDRPERADPLQ